MTEPTITSNKIVSFHYTLRSPEGEVLDTSSGGESMTYLHGAGNIVPGLERAMEGKASGEQFDTVVPPEDAYGMRSGPGPQAVPRDAFGDVEVEPGMAVMAEDDSGQSFPLWVTDVQDQQVMVDTNHPLSGVTLHFSVEVVSIRDATQEELEHGHPHEPGQTH